MGDDVWHKPLLNVDEINGLLYEGIPAFTFTKNLRHRVVSILETMLQIDMTKSINVSLEALGDINLHFVATTNSIACKILLASIMGTHNVCCKYFRKSCLKLVHVAFVGLVNSMKQF